MSERKVILSGNVTKEQCRAIRLYLEDVSRLRKRDWRIALEGFDSLRESLVYKKGESFTFEMFYKLFVEQHYTDQFIQKIVNSPDLEQRPKTYTSEYCTQNFTQIEERGFLWNTYPKF